MKRKPENYQTLIEEVRETIRTARSAIVGLRELAAERRSEAAEYEAAAAEMTAELVDIVPTTAPPPVNGFVEPAPAEAETVPVRSPRGAGIIMGAMLGAMLGENPWAAVTGGGLVDPCARVTPEACTIEDDPDDAPAPDEDLVAVGDFALPTEAALRATSIKELLAPLEEGIAESLQQDCELDGIFTVGQLAEHLVVLGHDGGGPASVEDLVSIDRESEFFRIRLAEFFSAAGYAADKLNADGLPKEWLLEAEDRHAPEEDRSWPLAPAASAPSLSAATFKALGPRLREALGWGGLGWEDARTFGADGIAFEKLVRERLESRDQIGKDWSIAVSSRGIRFWDSANGRSKKQKATLSGHEFLAAARQVLGVPMAAPSALAARGQTKRDDVDTVEETPSGPARSSARPPRAAKQAPAAGSERETTIVGGKPKKGATVDEPRYESPPGASFWQSGNQLYDAAWKLLGHGPTHAELSKLIACNRCNSIRQNAVHLTPCPKCGCQEYRGYNIVFDVASEFGKPQASEPTAPPKRGRVKKIDGAIASAIGIKKGPRAAKAVAR